MAMAMTMTKKNNKREQLKVKERARNVHCGHAPSFYYVLYLQIQYRPV